MKTPGEGLGGATPTAVSDSFAQIAVQGPKAHEILAKLLPEDEFPV